MIINIKGEKVNFIITCNHSITQEEIDSKLEITIYFGKSENEEKIVIKLDDKERLIKTYEDLDVTLIQILKEDKIKEKRFLYPDLNYKNIGFSIYKDTQIFTAGYPNVEFYKEGRHMSSGLITNIINEYFFEHNCDTRRGSSGSPILNIFKLVIGIHYGADKNKECNFGTFIGVIIEKLNKEGEKIIFHKEEKKPKKENAFAKLTKDMLKDGPIGSKLVIDMILPYLKDPEYLRYSRKLLSNPKINILYKQLLGNNFTGMENLDKEMKDLFDEDNIEEYNNFLKDLENIKNEGNNRLDEEDK